MMETIIFENKNFHLSVSGDCKAASLVHLPSGQECLAAADMPLFSVTQPRPFNNEVKLAYPTQRTVFPANRVRREGDKLIVGFSVIPYEAVVTVKVCRDYMSFRLEDFIIKPSDYAGLSMSPPPVESFRILQLPVKERRYFGQWLNVCHDEEVAVNVLGTSEYALVNAELRGNMRILTADADRTVKIKGVEAALIVSDPQTYLDKVGQLEEDYDLPRGVESRRREEMQRSIYSAYWINPDNVDAQIEYCKRGGFGLMTIYHAAVFKADNDFAAGNFEYCGDCDFRPEYPEGIESLRKMVKKIKDAGIIPGFHFLHSHIGLKSRYVTPVADHRLHLTRHFTLAKPLGLDDTVVFVEQNPENTVMADGCRILQFGGELISYAGYTTNRPYYFFGCERGTCKTNVTEHPLGQIGGILDVSEYCAVSCYLDQDSSLQEEVSAKLAAAYDVGFEYVYMDGSEGVNEPFAFHVSNAQYRTWKLFGKAPLFAEGAAKSHFGWHMLSGGNAFDPFPPEIFKEMIREHPVKEAPRMRQDFTRVDFGWWFLYETALQADHWEFGCAMATAWDCPVTVLSDLPKMDSHPRMDDLLEVLRRWNDAFNRRLLPVEQKNFMQAHPELEYLLLEPQPGNYDVVIYRQLETAEEKLRAFSYTWEGKSWVVFWHTDGEAKLSLTAPGLAVYDQLYEMQVMADENGCYPVSHRRYAVSDMSIEEMEKLFTKAQLR